MTRVSSNVHCNRILREVIGDFVWRDGKGASIRLTEQIELGVRSCRETGEREGEGGGEVAVDGSAKRITGCTRPHNTSLRLPCKASENERSQR